VLVADRRLWRVLVAGIPLGGVSVLLFQARRWSRIFFGFALASTACRKSGHEPVAGRDDFGDTIRIGVAPRRIVSLNPATTEILFTLGAGPRVVGRTEYDLWPDSARLVPAMGGGISVNVEAVLGAHPDLVLLYATQDNRSAADRLRGAGINTISLRVDHIADFRRTTELLGAILHDSARARTVVDSVQHTLDSVRLATKGAAQPKVFWHIWDSPLITVGSGSFMSELLDIAGATNVYADISGPSGPINLEDVARRDPDFILAGPIGAARIANDPRWRIVRAARDNKVLVVDTMLVARPAVRLGEAAVSLARLLHPAAAR
jgi:iron complex transport system substrate-binding protein